MDGEDQASVPWPVWHHDLRATSGNGLTHALLGWQRDRGSQGRIIGFRRAAELLAAAMLAEESRRHLDTVIFPFAHCWRHHIELQLKSLMGDLQVLAGEQVKPRGGHNLVQLWAEFEAVMRRAYGSPSDDDKRDFQQVTRLVDQLSQLDPTSEEFRYATRRKGGPTLPDVDRIDVHEFHQAMEGVANFLDAVDSRTNHHLDVMRQMVQDCARYHDDY